MRNFLKSAAVLATAALVLAGAAAPAAAQTIGFKVGPTFSNIDTSETEDKPETLTSFGGGGFAQFGFGGLSMQVEVLALTKGSRASGSFPTFEEEGGAGEFEFESELRLGYIEIPVTIMFELGRGPYVFGGGAVAFETSCKISAELNGVDFSSGCDDSDVETSLQRKQVDFGLVGGLGFRLPLGPGHFLIEGRYTHGLSNLNDDSSENFKLTNRSFAVFGGFGIPLGR